MQQSEENGRRSLGARFMTVFRSLSGPFGIASGIALTAFKLVALGTEKNWVFDWDVERIVAQVRPEQWPPVWVILIEGLVAAAAISIVFSYTVNNISHRISTIWQVMKPVVLPSDIVRADQETREWVNKLSAHESKTLHSEIDQLTLKTEKLQADKERLERDLDASNTRRVQEVSALRASLKSVVEQLKANDKVFKNLQRFTSVLQKQVGALREKSRPLRELT